MRARIAMHWLSAFGLAACAGPFAAEPDLALYERASADRARFRAELEDSCADELALVDRTISEAIGIGAPIYNAGSPLGCYRIYEGAAYKLIVRLDGRCRSLEAFLRAGLAKAESDATVPDRAWTLRHTFDTVLGEATDYRQRLAPPR